MGDLNEYDDLLARHPLPGPAVVPAPAGATADDKAQRNEYDELLDNYQSAVNQAASGTATVNAGANPDTAARAQELSRQLNVPPAIIESDLPTFEARAKAIHNNAVIASNPMLASWVANNREAARQAQDDFDKLGVVEKAMTALKTGGTAAIEQNQLGRLYNTKQIADTLGIATPDTDKEIAQVEGQMQREPELSGGYGLLQHISGFGFGLLDNFLSSAPEAVGGAGLGFATSGPAGAAVGALAGTAIGFKTDMARVSAGLNYRATQYVRGSDGQPLSQDSRQVGALVTGLLTYGLASIGTKQAGEISQEAIGQMTSEAVKRAMTRPTVTAAMKTLSKSIVKGGATGAAFMGGMEATNVLGEELAKQLSAGDFATVLNDPATREQAIERIANAAESGAVLFGLMHGVAGSAGLAGDLLRARQAENDVQMLKAVQDGASSSLLRGRNRQTFADFLQSQSQGSPVENLYVPADSVLKLYQGAKIDPNVERAQDPLFGWVKDMPQQLAEAKQRGGDIVIPTSDYVAHLAGTDIGNSLLNDVRVRPDAMSANEAKEFLANNRENLKKAASTLTTAQEGQGEAISTPEERVYQDVLQQAQAAGYGASAARNYAALYSARYTARAARLGIDPWEAYLRSGVTLVGPDVEQNVSRGAEKAGGLPIETDKNVPFAGGTDKTGGKIYIDKGIPRILNIGGKKVDVHQFIALHEATEKPLLDQGMDYAEAHKKATAAEKKAVEAAGIDWKSYSAALEPYITRAEHQQNPNIPHDLETKPYTEDSTKGVAGKDEREVLAAEGKTYAQGAQVNASGESAASLEAINRVAREKAAGQRRYVINTKTGAIRPLIGVDAADAVAKAGEIIIQKGIGKEPFSILSQGKDVSNEIAKGAVARFKEPMFQQERGSITISQGRAIINLFKGRDLSTLLHETGHLWLEELKADAANPNAPQGLRDDLAAVLKWMNVEKPEDIGVSHHEQFARAAEVYFMEGKPPSAALASVFQRFKAWLTHIYRTITNLNTPVTPEIKQVFDRLVATDDEIQQAQQSLGIFADQAQQKFRDRLSGLMTQAEFKAYSKAIDRANTEANETLLTKMMQRVKRERTAEWKAERAKVVEEVTPEIDSRPDIQALQHSPKLDRKFIEKIYQGNPAMMYFLPKTLLAKEGGTHPDIAAEMFGYSSGDAMIKALVQLEQEKRRLDIETGKSKGIRQHLIDQAADAKMTEKYGDLLNADNIREEALAAVHNQAQEEALATELKVLGRSTSQPGIPLDVAREWAANTINGKRVADVVSLSRYARAEASAARGAEMALLSDKPQEAYLHKRQQILNHLLYTAAQDAGKEIERGQKLFDRLSGEKTFKNIDQEYTDRIHELLRRFDVSVPRTPDELGRGLEGETLEGFVRRKFDEGYELAVDPMFFNPEFRGNVDRLTVGQFRALHDAVKSMQTIGRDENTILIGDERTNRDVAIAQMVSHLQALPQKKPSDWYRPEDAGTLRKIKERTLGFLRSADASLMKEEQLLDWMDGNDPDGPFNRYIFRPLKEAQLRADDMRRKVAKQIQDIVTGMPKTWSKDLEDVLPNDTLMNPKTGQPFKFNRKRMLAMALNVGNADNAAKLADGYGWTEPAVMAFLHQNMTEADWQFAQKMWDVVGQFRPDIDALQRRVTGVGIDFVASRPIQTKYGDIPGGYFPIVYDPFRSPEAERHLAKAATEMFENQYYRATTPKGFTIKRVQGVKRPIALDLDIIPWKVGQVIHDLNFREAIMNSGKLLSDKRVLGGIDDAFGHEYTKTLRPWLQSIANSRNINDQAVDWIDKSLRWMRTNATMVGIGFRLSTMYKHGMTALSNSVGELGGKWMLRGTREFFGTPEQMQRSYRFVMESSGEMRNRLNRYDRDIRENLKTLLDEGGLKADAQRYGGYGVSLLDLGSALPTWLGAYRKAMASEAEGGLGMGEKDAIYFADKTVRKAHGSQGLVDFAAIQRGNEFQKLLTMFYGFFNHIYNRQRDIVRQGRLATGKLRAGDYAGARRDFALVLARSMTYLVVPAIVESLYTTGGPSQKEEETWGHWVAHSILAEVPAGIPIVRDIAKAALEGRDYEYSPIVRGISTVVGTGKDIGSFLGLRDQEPSKKWLRHAIETAGYVTGLPTGQIGTSGQFLWDVADGEQQPQDLYDWYHGLSFGKTAEQ